MADHDGIVRVGCRDARDADNNGEPDGVDVCECVSIISDHFYFMARFEDVS